MTGGETESREGPKCCGKGRENRQVKGWNTTWVVPERPSRDEYPRAYVTRRKPSTRREGGRVVTGLLSV